MTNPQNDHSTLQKPLRLWPGVVLVILQLLTRYVVPMVQPEAMPYAFMASLIFTLLIILWWVFFSRAPWKERLGGLALMAAAVFVTSRLVHVSILKGAMGMLFYVIVVPLLCLGLVVWAVLTRNLSNKVRRVSMVMTILLLCAVWTLFRTGGFSGEFKHDFHWRWTDTPEERLLAQSQNTPPAIPPTSAPAKPPEQPQVTATQNEPAALPSTSTSSNVKEESSGLLAEDSAANPAASPEPVTQAEWPGFRGPERNGTIHGVRINTDWAASPPVELWRRQVGPGWSSFAVQGHHLYTQEQRGKDEVISCYNIETGKPVWMHRDAARFWESNAGAGPRGTPTLHNGRVYALGATGILNALNASDGSVVWSRNAAADTKTGTPYWGFASSPLIVDDVVIVATSGQLAGYDIANGNPRWFGPKGKTDYSSPHALNINGITQILLLSGSGAVSVAPATGTKLWEDASAGTRIVQPAITTNGELLISQGDQRGLRRVVVAKGTNGWTVKERWTSNGLKPYFSDFVIHHDHAYGFDGSFLSCIDLENGERKWKGGRYGSGQLLLLADQDLLLVLSEEGELALVSAVNDQFKEIARAPAIEGKTWNHPVLVGNVIVVRNAEEMAAFRVSSGD